jgi:hypothetical protein
LLQALTIQLRASSCGFQLKTEGKGAAGHVAQLSHFNGGAQLVAHQLIRVREVRQGGLAGIHQALFDFVQDAAPSG